VAQARGLSAASQAAQRALARGRRP